MWTWPETNPNGNSSPPFPCAHQLFCFHHFTPFRMFHGHSIAVYWRQSFCGARVWFEYSKTRQVFLTVSPVCSSGVWRPLRCSGCMYLIIISLGAGTVRTVKHSQDGNGKHEPRMICRKWGKMEGTGSQWFSNYWSNTFLMRLRANFSLNPFLFRLFYSNPQYNIWVISSYPFSFERILGWLKLV